MSADNYTFVCDSRSVLVFLFFTTRNNTFQKLRFLYKYLPPVDPEFRLNHMEFWYYD